MTDQHAIVAFCLGCAVVALLVRLVSMAERGIDNERRRMESAVSHLVVNSAEEFDACREELMLMMAQAAGVGRNELVSDLRFEDDLRMPPVELDCLLEDVQERFGIVLDTASMVSVGDLLDVVELRA